MNLDFYGSFKYLNFGVPKVLRVPKVLKDPENTIMNCLA
jgi:hypothetical protein